jgi:hypothetical protein
VKLLENGFENALEIAQNVVIPKTDDVISAFFQHRRTLAVRSRALHMLATVNLHNEFPIQCHEVDDESCKRNLPLEFDAIELTRPKSRPKKTLGVGGIRAESAGVLFQTLSPLTLPSPQRGEGHFA